MDESPILPATGKLTFLAYWLVGLPLAWSLGIGRALGPQGMWVGLVAGLTLAAVLLSLRFWRLSRVAWD